MRAVLEKNMADSVPPSFPPRLEPVNLCRNLIFSRTIYGRWGSNCVQGCFNRVKPCRNSSILRFVRHEGRRPDVRGGPTRSCRGSCCICARRFYASTCHSSVLRNSTAEASDWIRWLYLFTCECRLFRLFQCRAMKD